MRPTFRVFATRNEVAAAVGRHIADVVRARPQAVLGLATGKTFIPIYAELVRLHRAGQFSLAEAASFNLDEYLGLPQGHPASFRSYMDEHLFKHVDLSPQRAMLPTVEDLDAGWASYETEIEKSGGIDLQLLGIGQNGHIGFNEPGSPFDSRTRAVTLSVSTLEANTSDFPNGEVPPERAVTMGIGTILEAREIVLVALGGNKVAALEEAFGQPPTEAVPASALQHHPAVTVYSDYHLQLT